MTESERFQVLSSLINDDTKPIEYKLQEAEDFLLFSGEKICNYKRREYEQNVKRVY